MAKEISVVEQLCYNTTRIVTANSKNETHVASGFFMAFDIEGNENQIIPILVTNRHVVRDAQMLKIWVSEKNQEGDPIDQSMVEITIMDAFSKFIMHPDPEVDLAIYPLAQLIIDAEKATNKQLYYKTFSSKLLMTDEKSSDLDAVEEILMIGYPSGLWDQKNNRPIFRYGITATDPKIDYEGKREFLIDCACIQGSSGSPVLLYNRGITSNKFGKETKYDVLVAKLLGVQHSIPIRNTQGVMVKVTTPTSDDKNPVIGLPINLGYIVKIQCIFDFVPILEKKCNLKIKL